MGLEHPLFLFLSLSISSSFFPLYLLSFSSLFSLFILSLFLHAQEVMWAHREMAASSKTQRNSSPGTISNQSLILDFQLLKLWKNKCLLFKLSGLWQICTFWKVLNSWDCFNYPIPSPLIWPTLLCSASRNLWKNCCLSGSTWFYSKAVPLRKQTSTNADVCTNTAPFSKFT